ncbi:cellulase family glycosylhydrolase [Streptococcus suis]|uniref:cellulase family glycosylhydrolase n=1 Tax=Streptococcus suis TaxID=1307 RepID=UPI001921CEF0|nr:cellulase family glycosylhydrolase [Streptococcus suis]MBL1125060.1 cellulase family glycosylhydrolase [Streptococcus suis]
MIRWIKSIAVLFAVLAGLGLTSKVSASQSIDYMEQMGFGWNLGNTFDGFDVNKQLYEESWGNPRVTRDLLQQIKFQGFTSIRLPFSVIDRQDQVNQINEEFLTRYQAVVDMALDEGFYVMINLHHDSWQWLKYWDGQENSAEYIRYKEIWKQLADRFKDYDSRLSFESINEPDFESGDKHQKLQAVNKAFYEIVRQSGGNNTSRMLILPTLVTKSEQAELDATAAEILSYQDPNMMATVHYYSEWVFSNNLGITGFDQIMWDSVTARSSVEALYNRLEETFLAKGIGVVIGEYGLLAYDRQSYDGSYAIDLGELYKYVEHMSDMARETGVSLMLWDNGQHFNRQQFTWNNPWLGEIVTQSMTDSSAYGKGYWKSYVTENTETLSIPIEWNGAKLTDLEFVDISGNKTQLKVNQDYQISEEGVTLSATFVKQLTVGEYSKKGQLNFYFDKGTYWIQHLSYADNARLKDSSGTVGQALTIPVDFQGEDFLYGQLHDLSGNPVSTNSWWQYLTYLDEWTPDANKGEIYLAEKVTSLLTDGQYRLTLGTYQGTTFTYTLTVDNGVITGLDQDESQSTASSTDKSITIEEDTKTEISSTDSSTKDTKTSSESSPGGDSNTESSTATSESISSSDETPISSTTQTETSSSNSEKISGTEKISLPSFSTTDNGQAQLQSENPNSSQEKNKAKKYGNILPSTGEMASVVLIGLGVLLLVGTILFNARNNNR